MFKLKEILNSSYRDVVFIFESPLKLTKPYNPNELNSIGKNQIFTDIVKEKGKKIGKLDEYEIYEYTNNGNIFNILELNGYTCAFFQYIIKNNIVEEIGVWQSPTSLGLCRNFIFNHLLKNYDGFLSDDAHTELGQKYWNKLLIHSLSLGYKVFVMNKHEKIPIITSDSIDKFYFNSPKGMDYRFLIQK